MKHRIFYFILILSIIFSFNCSTNSSQDKSILSSLLLLNSSQKVSAVIGPEGGAIEVTEEGTPLYGAKVVIPDGAVDTTQEITIAENKNPEPPEEDIIVVGNTISLRSDIPLFNKDLTVTIPYNDKDNDGILDGTNIPETDIVVTVYIPEFQRWLKKKIISQDVLNNTVTFNTDHFSNWQVDAIVRGFGSVSTKNIIFTIDGLKFNKFIPFNWIDTTPRIESYLKDALLNKLNLNQDNYWIESYKGPQSILNNDVMGLANIIPALGTISNYNVGHEDSVNFLEWFANDNLSWSGNSFYTYNILEDLIISMEKSYKYAKSGNKKFIIVSHSWGTVLAELALLYAEYNNNPIKPDLILTLSDPRGSSKINYSENHLFSIDSEDLLFLLMNSLNINVFKPPFDYFSSAYTKEDIVNLLYIQPYDVLEDIVSSYSAFWVNYCKNKMFDKGISTNDIQFNKWINYYTSGDIISGPLVEIINSSIEDKDFTYPSVPIRNLNNTDYFHFITSLDRSDYPPFTEYADYADSLRLEVKNDILTTCEQAGSKETYTADSISFAMSYVPGGLTFPTGTDDAGTATVTNAYWVGESEVTYELWYKVYTWATDDSRGANQYTFTFDAAEAPQAGNDGTPGSETASQEPVTCVNWRHAMVWCNALTEWYNANNGTSPDLDCVYYTDSGYSTPIRSADDTQPTSGTAGSQDNPYVKATAKGFRLISTNEWELAARWRDDSTNAVSGYSNPFFTKGNSMCGATTYYNDNTKGGGEPNKSANAAVAVYGFYWDGSDWIYNGINSTSMVKSKGANALGLYDMSGNVWEWCFDKSFYRVCRGGAWHSPPLHLVVGQEGVINGCPTYNENNATGFRFSRTAD